MGHTLRPAPRHGELQQQPDDETARCWDQHDLPPGQPRDRVQQPLAEHAEAEPLQTADGEAEADGGIGHGHPGGSRHDHHDDLVVAYDLAPAGEYGG